MPHPTTPVGAKRRGNIFVHRATFSRVVSPKAQKPTTYAQHAAIIPPRPPSGRTIRRNGNMGGMGSMRMIRPYNNVDTMQGFTGGERGLIARQAVGWGKKCQPWLTFHGKHLCKMIANLLTIFDCRFTIR
ncbi:MAG: hypothetical protein GY805_25985 [Chloroflexi bacterium]|nr:hypothetical protein [Chloroflexota bacterium]